MNKREEWLIFCRSNIKYLIILFMNPEDGTSKLELSAKNLSTNINNENEYGVEPYLLYNAFKQSCNIKNNSSRSDDYVSENCGSEFKLFDIIYPKNIVNGTLTIEILYRHGNDFYRKPIIIGQDQSPGTIIKNIHSIHSFNKYFYAHFTECGGIINETREHLYLIQPYRYKNTNVYKIGQSTDIENRLKAKDYMPRKDQPPERILIVNVANSLLAETELKREFHNHDLKLVEGDEYFKGDKELMKKIIFNYVLTKT